MADLAREQHLVVGRLLVAFGAFGVTCAAAAEWVLRLELGFLSTGDMALIGLVTALVGRYLQLSGRALPDDASGTAGVAMASAQMLMHQASAAAQVIAALAATVKDLEQGGGRRHEDPASPA